MPKARLKPDPKHSLLLVDDEESILHALQRVFRKEGHDLVMARSGAEGLACLQGGGREFSLIISDQRMPGMTGTQFFEKAKGIIPDAARILLTGYADMEAIVEAINQAAIHRYLTKPWNEEELLFHVRQALRQYELITENRRLTALTQKQNEELREWNLHLEEKIEERTKEIAEKNETLARLNKELESNLFHTVRAFGSLIEIHSSILAGHGRRVSLLSREVAQAMGLAEEETMQVEIAALLHDIGKLGCTQRILGYQKAMWDAKDRKLYQQHAQQGQVTVQFINKLDYAGILIRSHHERFDGQGFPDNLAGEKIPLGSRIIAVADWVDKILSLKVGVPSRLKKMARDLGLTQPHLGEEEIWEEVILGQLKEQRSLSFDPSVTEAFSTFMGNQKKRKRGKTVAMWELEPGMILAQPLYSAKGRFLLSQGTLLTNNHIQKLRRLSENDPLPDVIPVVDG